MIHSLDQAWIRVWAASFYGLGMIMLVAVGISFLRDKDLGHKNWIRAAVAFASLRGVSSFVVAWDVYHKQTSTISPVSCVASAFTLFFAGYTIWVIDDLRRTLCSSEALERARQQREANLEQLHTNTTYLTFDVQRRIEQLSDEVLGARER